MRYINLGNTGLKVSRLCLGCMTYGATGDGVASTGHAWTLDEDASRPFFRAALEAGINFFDTANGYSAGTSEEYVGRALKAMARRDEVVIATKAYIPWRNAPNAGGLSRKALFQAVDDSLRRLGTDYIDLYQIHRWDDDTPIEETMEALHDIVKAGKARYIGASSMWAWQFAKAQHVAQSHGWTRFVSMQPEVNLLYREEEREMIPLCIDQGVGVIPWSPLARGKLTRPWEAATTRSQTDQFAQHLFGKTEEQDRQVVDAVLALARNRGVAPAQVALAWLLAKPGITAPIIGASRAEHLNDAIAALDLVLDDAEIKALEAPYVPHVVVGLAFSGAFRGRLTSPSAVEKGGN
ncbi:MULTISPECIES: aldo/keto reductase [Sphingobium]|uniref:Aldo/keto reductase n=1 Tax=Sphingobium cupriresistens TaxID=1132417 RepID=A0A8G2DU78_9SPHN|nr:MULTISPECIES: aldo/keto reductase [Sphingobium]MBJ7375305.1 aldo/keto reductase [Sphingobium sp.]RYM07524.1 aldo/keto reductase [Sphingobium cupriresistens]